jgi:hypothetical protein
MSTNMRALIDSASYFNYVRDYYRMFSYDTDFSGGTILIEPAKIVRFSTQSIDGLLRELIRYGGVQERSFLIVTHGNQNGLPIRIDPANPATLQHTIMDALSDCLSDDPVARASGRQSAMLYQAGGHRVFANATELNAAGVHARDAAAHQALRAAGRLGLLQLSRRRTGTGHARYVPGSMTVDGGWRAQNLRESPSARLFVFEPIAV